MSDKVQRQRFEYKYRITESKAQQIRFHIQSFLELDEFGATQPDRSYTVNSLYLDSPNMHTYNTTINGDRNRFKLRVRYYDSEETPIFFEIKRRFNKVIRKDRARVKHSAFQAVINGEIPRMEHLVNKTTDQIEALKSFSYLMNQLNASPKMKVSYRREAYELADSNAVRVTFDRHVYGSPYTSTNLFKKDYRKVSVFGNQVILEIKFTDRYPIWLNELIQRFHLRQTSAAKYVDSIIRNKEKKLQIA